MGFLTASTYTNSLELIVFCCDSSQCILSLQYHCTQLWNYMYNHSPKLNMPTRNRRSKWCRIKFVCLKCKKSLNQETLNWEKLNIFLYGVFARTTKNERILRNLNLYCLNGVPLNVTLHQGNGKHSSPQVQGWVLYN